MIDIEVVIVGGGPAGSTCAKALHAGGKEVVILDKQPFPRLKLCAGWITPQVVNDLNIDLASYPHSLVTFDRIYLNYRRLVLPAITTQYSIRRFEFDHWLLERSGVPVHQHKVQTLRRENDHFVIDDVYRCRYLVGAGGTNCPVYHAFFKDENPRSRTQQIVCLEQEFAYPVENDNCYLWFFENGLLGYSWYVPKSRGILNVGIGGKSAVMKRRGQTIHEHWHYFAAKLAERSLVSDFSFQPKGYQYYLRSDVTKVQKDHAYIIGDAAGLATVDMGEGIGPAVESALLAAQAILNGDRYTIESITKYSLPTILFGRFL